MLKMDEKKKDLLNSLLELMKYIIADCELREEPKDNALKYEDIENFAKAHENIEELLRTTYKEIYYHRELTLLAKLDILSIDFAQLQSTIEKKNEGDAYWKLYSKAIRENNAMESIELNLDPASSYPDFPKHFQMIKCALENKLNLRDVKLVLKGYSLENLNNFGHITDLYLDVRMSAEALVSVCKSNPELNSLKFMSTELQGRLSDIVPHCRNLCSLTFVAKPNVDLSEYAPLARLPLLSEMTIYGAFQNSSLLTMFEAIQKCPRPETEPLRMVFTDELPSLSSINIVRINSLSYLKISTKKIPLGIKLKIIYDFFETSSVEQSLETITLFPTSLDIEFQSRYVTLSEWPTSDIEISELVSLIKLFHLNNIYIDEELPGNERVPVGNGEYPSKAKLFGSMVPDELFALTSLYIVHGELGRDTFYHGQLNTTDTLGLVKIKSIKSLTCSFSDWESIGHLSELINLNTLFISVEREFENTYSKALCNLLNTPQVHASIKCQSWSIMYTKIDKMLEEVNSVKCLTIFNGDRGTLNELFETLANRDLIKIEEVKVQGTPKFKDILKVAEVQTLKNLTISLADTNGIEKLSELTKLEQLTISGPKKGSLIKLFDQLATMESPSLHSLNIKLLNLSPQELFTVSRIKSLKKLELLNWNQFGGDNVSLTELANLNLEELTVDNSFKLLAAFAAKPTNRLQRLNILDLRTFYNSVSNTNYVPFLQKLENLKNLYVGSLSVDSELNLPALKKLVIDSPIDLGKIQCLAGLENLESLTLGLWLNENQTDDDLSATGDRLADIQSLKELIIKLFCRCSHFRVYQALASKSRLNLKYLNAPIENIEGLNEIMKIKSLEKLHILFTSQFPFKSHLENNSELGKLEKLKALVIERTQFSKGAIVNKFGTELSILKACRNLDVFVIEYVFLEHEHFVSEVHNILKSVRDPACQKPLLLCLHDAHNIVHHLHTSPYINDDYLKVYYTNE